MNRIIEFRAWDKQTGKMHYLANQPYNEEIVDDELIVQICCTGAVGYTKNKYIGSNCLMQFTGLLDKNGKKIYEGDIVRFWANPKDYAGYKGHNYIAAVEWDQAFLQFIFSDGHGLKDFEFLEVIGNIFENPELLEG
jgi:uncharacterized phage protein (TIGR01671 family)